MRYGNKQLKKDSTAGDKKQAFKEGNMDNTGKINNADLQKDADKKSKPGTVTKQKQADK